MFLNKRISFFVIDYSLGGGVERVTSDLINIFIEKKISVGELVSLYSNSDIPQINYPKKISIEVLNPNSKNEIYKRIVNYFYTYKPDVFIFQGDNMTISLAILKAAKECGVHAIPQYHGSVYAYLKKYAEADKSNFFKKCFAGIFYPFKKYKVKKFINSAKDGLVCVSKGSAKELKDLFITQKASKITTIYNPIFLSEVKSLNKEKSISFVSRLESKHKNAFLIVKVWELLANKYPNWILNIYGSGSLEQKMKNYCSDNNIRNINFKGFVTDISTELLKSEISVSTSNCEGFSMAIAEAISAGNAIVATNSDGGIKDMLIPNSTALLSPKNDAVMLAKNLERLILNENLRAKLQIKAKENLKEIISTDIFNKWIELMKKLYL